MVATVVILHYRSVGYLDCRISRRRFFPARSFTCHQSIPLLRLVGLDLAVISKMCYSLRCLGVWYHLLLRYLLPSPTLYFWPCPMFFFLRAIYRWIVERVATAHEGGWLHLHEIIFWCVLLDGYPSWTRHLGSRCTGRVLEPGKDMI